ncbi:MAG: lysophospholipid acyltransferase family protein [Methylophilus sp.]
MKSKFSSYLCSKLFALLVKGLSLLPLSLIHWMGAILGDVFHWFKPKVKQILVENLKESGLYTETKTLENAVKNNVREMGKTMLESMAIWGSSQQGVLAWINQVHHFEVIEKALNENKGIIFLTPHIGAFEISSIFYASKYPMTILYRPSRQKCLNQSIQRGRCKGQLTLAPTDVSGVKKLLLALKKGEAIGILPDQIASKGDGEWANFFNRPAYTMTLVSKLVARTDAVVIMAVVERLSHGRGFNLHLERLDSQALQSTATLNQALERKVRAFPLQYMWNYDRFKSP